MLPKYWGWFLVSVPWTFVIRKVRLTCGLWMEMRKQEAQGGERSHLQSLSDLAQNLKPSESRPPPVTVPYSRLSVRAAFFIFGRKLPDKQIRSHI